MKYSIGSYQNEVLAVIDLVKEAEYSLSQTVIDEGNTPENFKFTFDAEISLKAAALILERMVNERDEEEAL
jgi:hypothetical protein